MILYFEASFYVIDSLLSISCHVLLHYAPLINMFLPLFDVDKGGENADMHKLRGSITHLAKNLPSSKRGSL
jgi:hypothetical protein